MPLFLIGLGWLGYPFAFIAVWVAIQARADRHISDDLLRQAEQAVADKILP